MGGCAPHTCLFKGQFEASKVSSVSRQLAITRRLESVESLKTPVQRGYWPRVNIHSKHK